MKIYTASYKNFKLNGVKKFQAVIYINGKKAFTNTLHSREDQMKWVANFINLMTSKTQTIAA